MLDPLVVFVVMIVCAVVLFFTGILIVSISILIQALSLRLMGSSADILKTYRTHRRTLDTLFCVISLTPALVVSYYWGALLVAPLFVIMFGYASQFTAIGTTVVMCVLLVEVTWKYRRVWREVLEDDVLSENRTAI